MEAAFSQTGVVEFTENSLKMNPELRNQGGREIDNSDGYLPAFALGGRINRKKKRQNRRFEMKLVESLDNPYGRHEKHDTSRAKSHKEDVSKFYQVCGDDSFFKDSLEESLWYAYELFEKKLGYSSLDSSSVELTPFLLRWTHGHDLPHYNKFQRVKFKELPELRTRHKKARRLFLKIYVKTFNTFFAKSIRLFLAGKVKDVAQGRIVRFFMRCLGIDDEIDRISTSVSNEIDKKVGKILSHLKDETNEQIGVVSNVFDAKVKCAVDSLGDRVSNGVNKIAGQMVDKLTSSGPKIASDILDELMKSMGSTVHSVYRNIRDFMTKNLPGFILGSVLAVILLIAIAGSCGNAFPTLLKTSFFRACAPVVQEDCAQALGIELSFAEVIAWLGKASSEVVNAKRVIDAVQGLWEKFWELIDYVCEKITGTPFTSKAKDRQGLVQAISKLSDVLLAYDPVAQHKEEDDKEFVNAYRGLMDLGRKVSFNRDLAGGVASNLARFAEAYEKAVGRVYAGKSRTVPLCVMLVGPPGTGKSTMVEAIGNLLAGVEKLEPSPRNFYYWKYENEYQETYDNEFATVLDDAFQQKEVSARAMEALSIINMVNTIPYPLHAASIAKKGVLFFQSKVVLCTSNDSKLMNLGIHDVNALKRRFHVRVYTSELKDGEPVLVDVELFDRMENGVPTWRLYKDVDMATFEKILLEAYVIYRRPPSSGIATLKDLSLKPSAPLDSFPSGYVRTLGDRVPIQGKVVGAGISEKALNKGLPKKMKDRGTDMIWKKKENKGESNIDGSEPEEPLEAQGKIAQRFTAGPEVQVEVHFDFRNDQLEESWKSMMHMSDDTPYEAAENFAKVLISHDGNYNRFSTPQEVGFNFEEQFEGNWRVAKRRGVCAKAFFWQFAAVLYPDEIKVGCSHEKNLNLSWEDFEGWQRPGVFSNMIQGLDNARNSVWDWLGLEGVSGWIWTGAMSAVLLAGVVGVLYLVFGLLASLGIVRKKPIDEAQSEDKFISQVQKKRAKAVARAVQKRRVTEVAQLAYNEHSQNQLAAFCAQNVHVKIVQESHVANGWMFFVKGGLGVGCLHFLRRDKSGSVLPGTLRLHYGKEIIQHDLQSLEKEGALLCQKEYDRFWIVSKSLSCDNLQKYFKPKGSDFDNACVAVLDPSNRFESSFTSDVTLCGSRDYTFGEETITASNVLIARGIPGAAGDCGRIFFEKQDNQLRLIGYHIAGSPERSLVSVITEENLNEVFAHFRNSLRPESQVFLSATSVPDMAHCKFTPTFVTEGQPWPVVGILDKPYNFPGKSGWAESYLVDETYGPSLFPKKLSPALLRERKDVNPLHVYAANFEEKVSRNEFPNLCDPEIWEGVFPKQAKSKQYRQFTFDEVVFRPHDVGLPAIDKTTCAGGEEALMGVTRKQLLDVNSKWHKVLLQKVAQIERSLDNGEVPWELHLLCPKDEPVSLEKVKEGRTRFFLIGSLAMQIVFRMYFGWFLVQQAKFRSYTDIAVGINPYGGDWEDLYYTFEGLRCSDADIKKWDVNFPRVIAFAFPYVASLYWTVPFMRMQLLLIAVLQCRVLVGRYVVIMFLLPSGMLLTAYMNSVANSVAHRMIARRLAISLVCRVFGDDSLVGWKGGEDILELIIHFRKEMFGWVSTSADKTGAPTVKSIDECQFLKRNFRKCAGSIVAPLDRASIEAKMLYWVQAKSEGEVRVKTTQNIKVALMEAALHEKRYFDILKSVIEPRWKEVDPQNFLPYTYEVCLEKRNELVDLDNYLC